MTTQQEQKNKRIAMMISIGFHAVLLIAFLLLMAWRAPNPPFDRTVIGVELNFGLDQQGGGEVQPEKAPGTEEDTPDPQEEQAQETPQEQSPTEAEPEKTEEPIVSKQESPVVVKEEKKEPTKEPVKENKTETKPKVTPKDEVKKEEPKEVVKTEYKPTETKPTEKKGDGGTSHGDDPGKVGDKGNPEGKLDSKALYGQQGGGGGGNGFGLSMAGWAWADDPKIPELPDNQDGRIEFEIECDEDGEIVGITTLHRGLSARAEQLLKDEIRRNSLMKTSSGQAPSRSKGRVVFILKTK